MPACWLISVKARIADTGSSAIGFVGSEVASPSEHAHRNKLIIKQVDNKTEK